MIDPVRPPEPSELDPIETASRDEIAALQLMRLRATLQHAYDNVAHYRARFDDAGLSPADLESLEGLVDFPFTVKEDLRRNYPFGMFRAPSFDTVPAISPGCCRAPRVRCAGCRR